MPSRTLLSTPNTNPNSFLHSRILLLTLTFTASALFLIALFLFLFYLYYTLINRSKTNPFDANTPLKLQKFSYRELKSATNSFNESNYIGKGGSGTVFRGVLRDGKSVAVKKLDSSSLQADREFQNELQILGGLRSQFVVSLLGYCVENKKRFLVYEFMPNKSLQESLFAEDSAVSYLNWEKRFEIILDIAKALSFLHLECDPPIIHGDVKPSNVLLGFDYRAKISDFGLSRIKTEGEFGIDLFSQELGRSEELLRSQDLSANLPETKMSGNQVDNSTTEVDFSLALQASSSSSFYVKNNRVDCNVKTLNLNSWNVNGYCGNEDDQKCSNAKGKEICTNDIVKEDCSKFVPDDEELCSIDHSKELNFISSSSLPIDDPIDDTMQWGKDWWWRQDGSGELCSKDYVTEWIGSQICPSTNPDWDEEKKNSPAKPNLDNSTQLDKLEAAKKSKFEELGCKPSKKRSKKKEEKGIKNCNKKQRKMQEWWKEENLKELSKKGNKLRKIEAKWKKGFKIQNFDLGRRFPFRKSSSCGEQNQIESSSNVDFSFRKGWKEKNSHSAASEMWSGDLFSRELSSTTSMRGTVCYVAPEYGGCGYLMEKADIYSLGVLILVIISGRRPLHVLNSPMKLEKANLINWCRQLAQTGNILELVDERLKEEYNKDQASLCINLALMCLKKMPELRPDIGEIVKVLKGEMDLPGVPFEFSPSPPSKLFSRSRRRAKTGVE
ncbi:Protein kinase domain [Macleaya cordata]|uniref:non-specific serine/threonine protein kinase n=1 Tax=Macleaya cordata TaxID=56857 RepID=A0A200PPD4_MACCD|nr:Protein kinase domain [Macleaya cordata]